MMESAESLGESCQSPRSKLARDESKRRLTLVVEKVIPLLHVRGFFAEGEDVLEEEKPSSSQR